MPTPHPASAMPPVNLMGQAFSKNDASPGLFSVRWRILLIQVFALLSFAIGCQSAHALDEREKGTAVYYVSGSGTPYKTQSDAAQVVMNVFCTYSCRNVVNNRTFNYSWNEWGWTTDFEYWSPPYNAWLPKQAYGSQLWDCRKVTGPITFGVSDQYNGICSRTMYQPDCCGPHNGKPIYPSTGIETLTEVDYQGEGSNHLRFARSYRSDRPRWSNNYDIDGIDFTNPGALTNSPDSACEPGLGSSSSWPLCFHYLGTGISTTNDFTVQRGNGARLYFGNATNLAPNTADINDRVSRVLDTSGNTIAWSVYNAQNDATEIYDLTGRIQTSTEPNGQVTTFTYSTSSTSPTIAPYAGLLIQVTDAFSRQLNFTYDSNGRMATLTDPAGGVYTYAYDESSSIVLPGKPMVGNLTSVTYPDGHKRIYWYNEQTQTASTNLPYVLTGATDENSNRYFTITYDSSGAAITTELAGGVDKYSFSYSYYVHTTVTDPLTTSRTYNFTTVLGTIKFTGNSQPAANGSSSASSSLTYDSNGNVATETDFNGNQIHYTYDLTRNLETQRVEAYGTAQARTISTQWHSTYRRPLQIAEPKKFITYTYDTSGNVLTKTEQATTDANGSSGFSATTTGNPRTWTYTYNTLGQVLTVDGPLTGSTDVTTYTYDTAGNLLTITDAAGNVTTLSSYDNNGRAGHIVSPDGKTTDLTYNSRGWLTQTDISDGTTTQTTVYSYDYAGQLTGITMPDSSTLAYTYDNAHRLTDITDNQGNTIHYVLDNMGNHTTEQVKDSGGTLNRQITRVYDALNRLQTITGGLQ